MKRRAIKLFLMFLIASSCLLHAQEQNKHYQIAACDWMMLKRQKLGEFKLAKEIHLDGVEVDMGSLGKRVLFENKLRDPGEANVFRYTADSLGIQVPSIAMSGFFAQNFITRENYKDLVNDCFKTMHVFGSKVAFLPLGGCGKEWQKLGTVRDSLVTRLHIIGEMAVKEGVIIGIRTALNAKDDKKLLREINSKGIEIYYNFQDAADNGRNICKELKILGKNRIAQIHVSNTDGKLLRDDPEIDMPKVKKTLDKIGYQGWLVIERSRDAQKVRDVKYNYGSNANYLHSIFQ
ncbi:MAG TPA: endonuclease [Prevotella sp.]|nr:endonuclease [Prevotella sp.]